MKKSIIETSVDLGAEELKRYRVIEEVDERTGLPRMRVEGVCQKADAVNRNGRFYPRDVLENARQSLERKILVGRGFGEVDHPEFRPHLGHTSHILNKTWWDTADPNLMCCDVTILDTPRGQVLKEIIRAGGRPGFSSRGSGETERARLGEKDIDRIKPGYDLQAFDFVLDPSVEESSIRKILESAASKIKEEDERMNITSVAELRMAFPDIVKEIEEKILEDAVALHEKETDERVKGLEAKLADAEKKSADLLAEAEGVSKELTEKDALLGRYSELIASITKLLEPEKKEEKKEEGKIDESVLTSTVTKLEESIAKLEEEKKGLMEQVAGFKAQESKLAEDTAKMEVKDFIEEQVKGNPNHAIIRTRLEGCATVEEAKAKLADVLSLAKSIEENFGGKGPKPKGQEGSDEDLDSRSIREEAKRRAGIKTEVKK